MKTNVNEILKSHGMSVTTSRQLILNLFFAQKEEALKHSDIEKQLAELDRVTIYRTLQIFCEKGLIHSIPGNDGVTRYALCHNDCGEGIHHDNHVHFYCIQCGTTQCLNHVQIPEIIAPENFKVKSLEMLINGICNRCNSAKT
jgi:Fur family ferric uptake transcriptional regulator